MHTVTRDSDNGTDTLPPPHVTPYFRRVLERAAAERGLPPEPWTA